MYILREALCVDIIGLLLSLASVISSTEKYIFVWKKQFLCSLFARKLPLKKSFCIDRDWSFKDFKCCNYWGGRWCNHKFGNPIIFIMQWTTSKICAKIRVDRCKMLGNLLKSRRTIRIFILVHLVIKKQNKKIHYTMKNTICVYNKNNKKNRWIDYKIDLFTCLYMNNQSK